MGLAKEESRYFTRWMVKDSGVSSVGTDDAAPHLGGTDLDITTPLLSKMWSRERMQEVCNLQASFPVACLVSTTFQFLLMQLCPPCTCYVPVMLPHADGAALALMLVFS